MTLLAAASPATPFQLTEPNLRSHTSLEGIAPRRTVQIYLNGITEAQGFFDIPSDTIVDSETPPSLGTLAAPRALAPAPSSSKRRQHVDSSERDEPAANTALVMHTHFAPQGALKTGAASSARPHKKPSLVSAMRPRLSSVPRKPSPEQDTGKEARRKDPSALPAPNGNKENTRVLHRRERANRGRKIEVFDSRVGPAVDKSAEKGKGRLRAEVEDDEEAKELEERLEARRERRRNKAFIRKDRSQTAKATGIAAAAAITKTNKRRTHGDEISDPEGETIGRPQSKKGRRSAEQSGREVVQGLDRPAAIGPGRLTLKSSTQLGMFNKGKASARVEVGKAVPDLAFSEMRFLNSTRLTHAMFELESSSGEEGATAAAEATQAEQMSSSLRKTYGSKKSGGRRLSSRAQIEEATSIVSTGARDLPRHTRPANPRQKIADWPPASEIPQSRHERELGSRSSSRSSRRQQGLEPEQIACDDSLRPRHDALGAVAQESDFSAHSAHSLAVRRRARRGVFHSFPPTQETEHHQEQQSDESMQAEEGAEAQRAQVVQEASLSSPHKGRSPDSGPPGSRSEPPQKQGSLSRFSLDTASIDRILRDNSSSERHVDVRLQTRKATFPSICDVEGVSAIPSKPTCSELLAKISTRSHDPAWPALLKL
ncbi:hypothetical protein JCM3766R1_005495 [Sporobolomyces carnicolor]